jgi:PAP2 superfamily
MGIISIITKQAKKNITAIAKIFALTSCAIFDGFVQCWYTKYKTNKIRPITFIRQQINQDWNSLLQTPSFPEYTSGHSLITAAAATVLTKHIGDNFAFTDTTELEYLGLKRSFISIRNAADEAGISRLYGGIHFRSAIVNGKWQGEQVGNLYNRVF